MNINELIAFINARIYENGNQEITGETLNQVLVRMTQDLGSIKPVGNLTGYISLASTDDLPASQSTIGYLIDGDLYVWVGEGGDTASGTYQNCGPLRGPEGKGIVSVVQTVVSNVNGGENTIRVTLTDGTEQYFQIRNGKSSAGLYPTSSALESAIPSPKVGDYAFVGDNFPADIYVCATEGTWEDSGEDYDGDGVDLTDYATKAQVTQLGQELNGKTILDYSGTQALLPITPVENDTPGFLSITGNTEDILRVRFLKYVSAGNYTTLLTIDSVDDWSAIPTTIPAETNTVGIYEKSGKTLSIAAKLVESGIRQDIISLEQNFKKADVGLYDEADLLAVESNTGLRISKRATELSAGEKMLLNAIKSIAYYDSASDSIPFLRLGGFYTNKVQITLTYNHSAMFDFVQNVDAAPTGVKTYRMTNGTKVLQVTIDWSVLTSNYADATSTIFYIDNAVFRQIIWPLYNEVNANIDSILGELYHSEDVGYNGTSRVQSDVPGTIVTPVKVVSNTGKISSVYIKAASTGTFKLHIGNIDQYYLFIPRKTYEIPVLSTGENTIDVSALNIYVLKGERVALEYVGDRYIETFSGTPENENGFYYGNPTNKFQLQVYGNPAAYICFGFRYTVIEGQIYESLAENEINEAKIESLNYEVGALQSAQDVISDRSGNKYKMVVVDGEIRLFALEFSHMICVGNSYTIHPTTTDTATDYRNNLWWGHWSMAASSKDVAWTTLLQTSLRQKQNDAVVTPVFGRRYETGLKTLQQADAFQYWTGSAWANLSDNLASFSDVDCVLFFLGDNYTGDNWYNLYKPMLVQFMTWFPNATIICCSDRSRVANNASIAQAAEEIGAVYVNMVGVGTGTKIGSYVYGDDDNLHQINNSAVAGHPGDYGEWQILDKIVSAIGYQNNTALYDIAISNSLTGVTLSVKDNKTIEGSVVSVFADIASGASLSGITVTSGGNAVSVTDHGTTDYGRVFTFVMPAGDVSISPSI